MAVSSLRSTVSPASTSIVSGRLRSPSMKCSKKRVAFHGLQGKAQQLRDQRVMSSARRRANENRLAPSLA
jgi:hypothetical protein